MRLPSSSGSAFLPAAAAQNGASSRPSLSLPGCPDKCGDVLIPYPFGIGAHCAATNLSSYFNLICNDDMLHPPRPTLGNITGYVEVTNISLETGEIRVLIPVSYICFTSNTKYDRVTLGYELMQISPFRPSPSRNRFTVIGCNTLGIISGYKDTTSQYVTGCYSYCESINSTSDGALCAGMGCCEVAIPANLTAVGAIFEMNQSRVWNFNPCFYAMAAEVGWYSFRQQDLRDHLGLINRTAPGGSPLSSIGPLGTAHALRMDTSHQAITHARVQIAIAWLQAMVLGIYANAQMDMRVIHTF